MSKEMINGWIRTDNRLPDDQTRTLVTIKIPRKGKSVRSGFYINGCFFNDNGDVWNATDQEVLAWMPLPEPYKEGKQ